MEATRTIDSIENNLIRQMREGNYFREYDSAVKRFPVDTVIIRLEALWKQKCRWEEISVTSSKVLNFVEKENLSALYNIIPEEHCDSFINFSLGDRFERLRTLLRIAEVIKSPVAVIKEKKWQGPLLKALGFYIDKRQNRPLVYVKTRRIYKNKGKKTVYVVRELVSNKLFSATFTPDNRRCENELRFPGIVSSKDCPALVPSFNVIYQDKKWKGGNKLLAIGKLFANTCYDIKFSYYNHTRMMLTAMKGADYLHDKGYAHRDIKPTNIFCSFEGTYHLGDFGSAVSLGSNMTGGTRWYSSPEVYTTGEVTPQNAVWEIAIMGFMHITNLRLSDNLLDLKSKGLLTQGHIDDYLKLACKIKDEAILKLIQFYTPCLRVNPNERPLLKNLIKAYEGFL